MHLCQNPEVTLLILNPLHETEVIQYVVRSDTFLQNFGDDDLVICSVVGVTKHFCVVCDSLLLLIMDRPPDQIS